MGNRLFFMMVIAMAFHAAGVGAQNAPFERDPFSPSAKSAVAAAEPAGAWGRDPFNSPLSIGGQEQPGQVLPREGHEKVLTGIIYSKDARIAIINGEARREGDRMGDRKIADIKRSSVVLVDQAGQREELFLENYSVAK